MSEYPRLSIVIPSHSRPDLLVRCLESLRIHSPSHTEIIVVDDGSADGCISKIAELFSGLLVLRNEKATGFCRAANRGIFAATGEIVELLNDDAHVTAGWADVALQAFTDPSVGSVAPLVMIDEAPASPRIDSAGDDYDLGGFARKRGHRLKMSAAFSTRQEVFGASGSSAFYRRDLLQSLGGFPSDFGSYFEDVDLSWRIHHAGFKTVYEPNSLVWHRVGSSHRRRRRLSEQQSRNEERVFWRNVPDLKSALPRHLAVLIGKSIRRIQDGTFWPFAFGRLRAISELREHLRHRQNINISAR